jgi:hypothetical protein
MKPNVMVIMCGNCRTFQKCIDSCYDNVISKLFSSEEVNISLYLYLKLTDPGPKGTEGWNYIYDNLDRMAIISKINDIKERYKLDIDYTLLDSNEITDEELLSQVKDRSKYLGVYAKDSVLLRGLHCHYNFEKCGEYILEKEASSGKTFDSFIYIRPDLYFVSSSRAINTYDNTKVTLGSGPNDMNNDHIAIIPRNYFKQFFFSRMETYRNNLNVEFYAPEFVYWHGLHYNVDHIGKYHILRT